MKQPAQTHRLVVMLAGAKVGERGRRRDCARTLRTILAVVTAALQRNLATRGEGLSWPPAQGEVELSAAVLAVFERLRTHRASRSEMIGASV